MTVTFKSAVALALCALAQPSFAADQVRTTFNSIPVNAEIVACTNCGGAGGGTPTGTAGAPNAQVVTVQGITNGTPQNVTVDGVMDAVTIPINITANGTNTVAYGPVSTAGFGTVFSYLTSVQSGVTVFPQVSTDGVNWTSLTVSSVNNANSFGSQFGAGFLQYAPLPGGQFRVLLSGTSTAGTTTGSLVLKRLNFRAVVDVGSAGSLGGGFNTIGAIWRSFYFNDTTTALGSSATFTGTARDTNNQASGIQYNVYSVFARADQAGTLNMQGSNDNTTWFTELTSAVAANTPVTLTGRIYTRYHRAQFINGATAQGSLVVNSQLGE